MWRNSKSVHCFRKCKMVQPPWKTVCSLLKKEKNRIIIRSSNSTSGYIPQRIESRLSKTYLYTHVHCSILTIAKRWKQPKCPTVDEWISKLWYTHIMEYSALKGKEILTPATTWMNLEDIMLNETSQSQKDKYFIIPPI